MKTIILLLLLAVPAFAQTVNYPELGGVDGKTTFYSDGAIITHPSGVQYIHEGGNWVIYHPGIASASVPEPSTWILVGVGLLGVLWLKKKVG